ncbi:MAG TPA: hypothetical protein VHA37_09305 [Candidatus Saccharimonadales bacterium]|nr:hypothetical protein [Candidatus Saccharimonadales bacterium]
MTRRRIFTGLLLALTAFAFVAPTGTSTVVAREGRFHGGYGGWGGYGYGAGYGYRGYGHGHEARRFYPRYGYGYGYGGGAYVAPGYVVPGPGYYGGAYMAAPVYNGGYFYRW